MIYILLKFIFHALLRLHELHYCVASVRVREGVGGIRTCGAVLPDPEVRPRWCGVCGAQWGPWDPEERYL